ncbi:MAG: ROK family protein [Paraclostridium sp.]
MKKYICLDIGGTYIKNSIIDENGNIIEKGKVPTIKDEIDILENIKNIIRGKISNYEVDGVCISSAGIVDGKKGKIILATMITNYSGLELKREIESEFNVRCEVENDVNCVGIAESWTGEAKGSASSVCLAIGTGIGGCIIIDGKLINGFSNSAGELGYLHIKDSRFSQIATTSALTKKVSERKQLEQIISGEEIFDLAKSGDDICIEEIDNMLENLSLGIANIIYILNPEVIILGGGIMSQEEYIKNKLDTLLEKHVVRDILCNTRVKFAKNQNDSGMIGALKNFLNKK